MELDSQNSNSSSSPPEDDWSTVSDPNERRKIQNRNAQRKFREKQKQQRQESERTQENQQRAADAYTVPDPDDVAENGEMSGLPWGGMSLRHIFETGKTKEQSSRESSLNAKVSQSGGSSRLGLRLIDQYARGNPAWTTWSSNTLFAMGQDNVRQPQDHASMQRHYLKLIESSRNDELRGTHTLYLNCIDGLRGVLQYQDRLTGCMEAAQTYHALHQSIRLLARSWGLQNAPELSIPGSIVVEVDLGSYLMRVDERSRDRLQSCGTLGVTIANRPAYQSQQFPMLAREKGDNKLEDKRRDVGARYRTGACVFEMSCTARRGSHEYPSAPLPRLAAKHLDFTSCIRAYRHCTRPPAATAPPKTFHSNAMPLGAPCRLYSVFQCGTCGAQPNPSSMSELTLDSTYRTFPPVLHLLVVR
nr:apicidin f cluster transcription factor apf2 [Quercus suber]